MSAVDEPEFEALHATTCVVWSSHDPCTCGGQGIADGIDALVALFESYGHVDENREAS